jgi:GT2 family glycosyltransferase
MTTPLVTVVIPTHGRPQRLRECLDALTGQSLRDAWEVVVVDDGSPTPVEGLETAFSRRLDLRVIRQANAGPSAARNRGVAAARADLIAFTDDDCRPDPAWLTTLVQAARERPDALVGGTTFNGLPDRVFTAATQLIIDLVYEHFNADPENAYFLTSNNILCQRERFLAVGGFDESFGAGAEDRDFCDRWRMAGLPLVWEPAARVEHRHLQTLGTFVELHVRYGRGAYHYQAIRRSRGSGTMREDIAFHGTLPRRVWQRLRNDLPVSRWVPMTAALSVWQAVNAAGFLFEKLSGKRR